MGAGDPTSRFKEKRQFDAPASSKVDRDAPAMDAPVGNDKKLPEWAKMIIATDLIMVHLIVILVGVESIPFTLNDWALAAYITVGLGMPVGLANRTVLEALANVFRTKGNF